MSLVLAIETSNPGARSDAPAAGVALGRPGPLPEVLGVELLERGGDDELLPAIDRLVREAGEKPGNLTRIGVSIGPGGFTGVRIAVAAAKMIAEVTGATCTGIPTARVVAQRVHADGRMFAVALASKRDTAHLTVFDPSGKPRDEGEIVKPDKLGELGITLLIADAHLPATFRQRAVKLGIAIEPPRFDPVACLELALELPGCDPAGLAPLYPREPEAVTRWRELHGDDSAKSGGSRT